MIISTTVGGEDCVLQYVTAGVVPAGGELPRDVGQGPRPPQQDRECEHRGGAGHPGGQEQGPEVRRHPPPYTHCRGSGTTYLPTFLPTSGYAIKVGTYWIRILINLTKPPDRLA